MTPLIALTAGEPAGIGLDLLISLMPQLPKKANMLYVGDPELLAGRAKLMGEEIRIIPENHALYSHKIFIQDQPEPALFCRSVSCPVPCIPGTPQTDTASYVLETLSVAANLCLSQETQALVTGPVHKGIINEAGFLFSGHTEWLQTRTQAEHVVMLMANPNIRVALSTTHIPLASVSQQLTQSYLEKTIRVIHTDMQRLYGIAQPRIAVLGLNPHAGEGGHMGLEETQIIEPCLNRLRKEQFHLIGPLSADTAFLPNMRRQYDVVLAQYHDQGLPVIKTIDFDRTVNVTLGLPIFRTSVDHGTALELVGKKVASTNSFKYAIDAACSFAFGYTKEHAALTSEDS